MRTLTLAAESSSDRVSRSMSCSSPSAVSERKLAARSRHVEHAFIRDK